MKEHLAKLMFELDRRAVRRQVPPAHRESVMHAARQHVNERSLLKGQRGYVAFFALFLWMIIFSFFATAGSNRVETGAIWLAAQLLGFLGLQVLIDRIAFAAALRQHVYDSHVRPNQCFECGYNLKGSTSATCPECGAVVAVD